MRRFFLYIAFFSFACWCLNGCTGRASDSGAILLEQAIRVTEVPGKRFIVPERFNGFNAQLMRGPSWSEPAFLSQVNRLNPAIIRYPGGTVASYWDWKRGGIDPGLPIRNSWRNIEEVTPNKLEDLKKACDAVGAVPLFVLNMVHGKLEDQLAMLQHASSIGLPIKFVELDNELYLGDEDYVSRFPGGADYAREANQWISAIKKQYPGVKVAVVGYASREGGNAQNKPNANRAQNWNRDVLSVIQNANAMTFHLYGGTGLNFMRSATAVDSEANGQAGELQKIFDQPRSMDYVLTSPMLRWSTSEAYDYKILKTGMNAWITEYNLFEKEGVVAGTWAHGIYALLLSMQFMKDQRTEMICYHNLSTSAQFAAIFNSDDGFFKSVKQKPTEKFGLTAAGVSLRMFGEALKGSEAAIPLEFNGAPIINGARGKSYNALQGWNFKKKKGSAIILINLSASSQQVNLSEIAASAVKAKGIYGSPHAQIGFESDLKEVFSTGKGITLQPYSITLAEAE